jgi:hypothetical protein
MQTKAELEAELALLRLRVAELEGAVEAYRYAIATNQPLVPQTMTDNQWWWTPQIMPCTTITS